MPRSADASQDDPLEELLAQCLEGDSAENSAALERACREHPEHARELRARVAALARLGIADEPASKDFPDHLGEFELLERLGGGGMGVVFRAHQGSLGREVALKVIRPEHLFFERARERFRRETEAVARLQHPGIVPIYSVGEDGGVPYFAMELVSGATLGEVLAALQGRAPERLTGADFAQVLGARAGAPADAVLAPDRLATPWIELCCSWILDVADALEHAHGRGVLHRDVKPSNIVVGLDGRARLIDFGLASLGDETHARLTASGATLGSMLYMSPEQLRGEARHASERSDVYALGVTLYELLCLQAPFFATSVVDLRESILQGRIDGLRARNRAVSRDLEVVCLKALATAPAQRYESASAFARDLRNVLEHRPILARPPSALSKLARWVQRNRAASTAIAIGVAALVGVPSALFWQERSYAKTIRTALDDALAARAEAERQRHAAQTAEQAAGLERDRALAAEAEASRRRDEAQRAASKANQIARLLTEIFTASGPAVARGREVTARDLLDEGLARVQVELAGEPDIQAELLDAIGSCYSALSEYALAEEALATALEQRRELHGERSIEVADSYFGLAHALRSVGDPRALEYSRRALALQRELAPEATVLEIEYLNCVAISATADADRELAVEHITQARRLLDTAPEAPRRLRANVLSNQANILYRNRRYAPAVDTAREALRIERELGDEPHPGLTNALNVLAISLKHLRQYDEALATFDELIDVGLRLHGENNDKFATFLLNKAALLEDLDRVSEALELLERSIAIFDATAPPAHPQRITAYGNLGGLCARSGRWEQGRGVLDEIVPRMVESLGPRHFRTALAQHYLGLCCEGVGELEAARSALSVALETTEANYGEQDLRAVRLRGTLACVLERLGDDEKALALASATLERTSREPKLITVSASASLTLGRVLLRAGDAAAARWHWEEAIKYAESARPDHWSAHSARIELAALAPRGERPAARDLESQFTAVVGALGAEHPESLHCRALLDVLGAD